MLSFFFNFPVNEIFKIHKWWLPDVKCYLNRTEIWITKQKYQNYSEPGKFYAFEQKIFIYQRPT